MEAPTRSLSVVTGSTISTHDVNYTVKTKVPGKIFSTQKKQILDSINAIFKPGMNAILGPTGSGKSSLLDVIAGRKDPEGLEGTLLVDGNRQPKNFKCMTGYVVQDDVVAGTLTVRENLTFSANLRLSSEVSIEEKHSRIDDTLKELGLEKCADTKVGTQFIRGVSGGERKRTNIGMELIVSPSVLFLDEPTTGLDASTANSVMHLLKRLSLRGRTIIFSIHQPRFTIFSQFDYLTLLSLGRTVYHGDASESLDYFQSLGYICEEHNNPPDFFLDVIQGDRKRSLPRAASNIKAINDSRNTDTQLESDGSLVTSFSVNASNGTTSPHIEFQMEEDTAAYEEVTAAEHSLYLNKAYLDSGIHSTAKAEIDKVFKLYQSTLSNGSPEVRVIGEYAQSFSAQTKIVAQRAIKNVFRNPQTSVMQSGMMLFMALLVGILYLQLDNSLQSGIQNRAGALFFSTMNMVFSSMSGIAVFIEERAIFVHENVSGFYRVSSYFVAKVLCDMLPLRFFPVTIYSVISYFMIGYQLSVEKFFIYYLTLFMSTFVGASIAFMASGFSPIYAVANMGGILIILLMMIFGGLLLNVDTLGSWISWMKYLSLFRYTVNALYINELKDMEFCGPEINGTAICSPEAGNAYLINQGIPYTSSWDLWINHVALASMIVFFLLMAYIMLRIMKKLK